MMLAVARRFPHPCQGPEKHRGASRGLALIPYLPGDVLSFAFPELGLFMWFSMTSPSTCSSAIWMHAPVDFIDTQNVEGEPRKHEAGGLAGDGG